MQDSVRPPYMAVNSDKRLLSNPQEANYSDNLESAFRRDSRVICVQRDARLLTQ